MKDPIFLTIDEVAAIHLNQIDLYGGSPGLRDHRGLESALAQPMATFQGQFLHGDLYSMAAAYMYHLVQNHPFIDGNKRVGAVSALIFLDFNGVQVKADQDELVELVLGVAQGQVSKDKITAFLKRHANGP
jgi:death-on-curing protein